MRPGQIIEKLKKKGFRLTKTRRAIVEILTGSQRPISAQEIWQQLKTNGVAVDRTTVYRELWFLKSESIVQEVSFGESKSRFELAGQDCHHHLICQDCGEIEDIVLDEKKILSQVKDSSFKVVRHSIEFFGLCTNCQTL